MISRYLFLLICFCTAPLYAATLETLKSFISATHSLQADFEQATTSTKGTVQRSQGTLAILRPGKFNWHYVKPYEQWIIGDGKKVWLYDPELAQVSVKKLDEALGSSPAALLAGNNNLEKDFSFKELGEKDQLSWLEALPRQKESQFTYIRMGFRQQDLMVIELHDNFGQTTVIHLSKLKRNPLLSNDKFQFVPPKGVDVVGDN